MKSRSVNLFLALLSGILLALMIHTNSILAQYSIPILASWVTHGVGSLPSFFLIIILCTKTKSNTPEHPRRFPFWAYLGGIAGAMVVVLTSVSVNSTLGI